MTMWCSYYKDEQASQQLAELPYGYTTRNELEEERPSGAGQASDGGWICLVVEYNSIEG